LIRQPTTVKGAKLSRDEEGKGERTGSMLAPMIAFVL